jgi:hypothetical protein
MTQITSQEFMFLLLLSTFHSSFLSSSHFSFFVSFSLVSFFYVPLENLMCIKLGRIRGSKVILITKLIFARRNVNQYIDYYAWISLGMMALFVSDTSIRQAREGKQATSWHTKELRSCRQHLGFSKERSYCYRNNSMFLFSFVDKQIRISGYKKL